MKFYLINPNGEQSSIFADINFRKFRQRISTGIVVDTKFWNQTDEKLTSKHPEYSLINARLNLLRGQLESHFNDLKIKKLNPELKEFNKAIQNIFENKPADFVEKVKEEKTKRLERIKPIYLLDIFDEWIMNRSKSQRYRIGTIKRYRVSYNHLKAYSDKCNRKLTLNDMDMKFFDKFTAYLQIDKNLVDNSIGAVTKLIKAFLKDIDEAGEYIPNREFRKLKVLKDTKPPTISIDESEVIDIMNLEIKEKRMEEMRDLFVFQVQSLQRVGDLFQIREEHIDLKKLEIRLVQEKTNTAVTIPISKKMDEILTKYNYILPSISSDKYNDYLKKIFEMAGIDDKVEVVQKQGKDRKVNIYKKFELAASHVARRAGITILLRKGVLPEDIMKISGHNDRRTLDNYIKTTQIEAVNAVRSAWDS